LGLSWAPGGSLKLAGSFKYHELKDNIIEVLVRIAVIAAVAATAGNLLDNQCGAIVPGFSYTVASVP
jgi:hypothetical protein